MDTPGFDANGVCLAEFAELEAAIDEAAEAAECRLCGGPADFVGLSIPDRVAGGRAFPFCVCPDCRKVEGWRAKLDASFDDSEGVSLERTTVAVLAAF